MSRNLVWISPHLPYDTVDHAGGQTQNYYLNQVIDSGQFKARLLSFYWDEELEKFTIGQKVPCDLIAYHGSGVHKILRNVMDLNYQRNPFHKYANKTSFFLKWNILRTLRDLKKKGYAPDIIVLEWTQVILFVEEIQKLFPKAQMVGIEEDVTFQALDRKITQAGGRVSGWINKIKRDNIYRQELNALQKCSMVIVNNAKDHQLLSEAGIKPPVKIWSPYFRDYSYVAREGIDPNKVLYFGDMSRPENYLSAQWFIQKVMPLLKDTKIRYEIIGGRHPDQSLYQYESDTVHIAGYVEDISKPFAACLCMAIPLVLGAGIKVKVLEAMSAGIPILTNEIGIEGIPATDGKEYFFCETPEQYAHAIRKLQADPELSAQMSASSREFIREHFNYKKSSKELVSWLKELL